MEPIHEHIARAHAIHCRRQLRGNVLPIDVDDESGFARIVEALAYAHGEECGVLLHELPGNLALCRHGRCNG